MAPVSGRDQFGGITSVNDGRQGMMPDVGSLPSVAHSVIDHGVSPDRVAAGVPVVEGRRSHRSSTVSNQQRAPESNGSVNR